MNAKQLIGYLSTRSPDALVVLSSDAEGNELNYLDGISQAVDLVSPTGKTLQRIVLWPDSTQMDTADLFASSEENAPVALETHKTSP